jgi:hypothetical protein
MCVLIPPYVSSYLYVCVLIPLYVSSSYLYICVLIPLYMCPHTSICVLIPHTFMSCALWNEVCVSSYLDICVLIHTSIYVSSYLSIYVSILLYMCPHTSCLYVSSRLSIYLSAYVLIYYICPHIHLSPYVLIPLYICVLRWRGCCGGTCVRYSLKPTQ